MGVQGKRSDELRAIFTLRSGASAELRRLGPEDIDLLGAYFSRLSSWTTQFYGPHPFNQETAESLCRDALADTEVVRIVVTVEGLGGPRIIAYFIIGLLIQDADMRRYAAWGTSLDERTDAYIAPSVEDGYQNSGVGSSVMGRVMPWLLRQFGRQRLILLGGVQQRNELGIAFYRKWGFRIAGEFHTKIGNYDMIAPIRAFPPRD